MFEVLFKYPLELFAQGTLVLLLPWWQLVLIALLIPLPVFLMLGYFRAGRRIRITGRLGITLLRSVAISLVLFSLTRPLLEVSSQVPQSSLVGILLDNSISMQITDYEDGPRSNLISRQLDSGSGELLRALQQKFDTRLFKFGTGADVISDIRELDFKDGSSNLKQALEVAQDSLKGQPLAAMVVISDGANQATAELDKTLLQLRSRQIPIYTIGVGRSQYARDIEISRVSLPRRVLKGSRLIAEVTIDQQGYDGEEIELLVEDDSRIVHKQVIRLAPGGQLVKLPLDTDEADARQLIFRLSSKADEQIQANNSRQAVFSVDDEKKRILYFEGEPRFEFKFIRRAVADDDSLAVAGLVRTADAKFYRIGIESEKQLDRGFPMTREELFGYHALVLGSVEIALLSREQQAMIVEFVSERGGGLLMLGGRHAFAEGGYADSLIEAISPVVLAERAEQGFSREIKIQPTKAALVHPALLLADSYEKSIARWLTLPPLTTVNPIYRVKPGATLLLTGRAAAEESPYVVLASQRYGRGKVLAFTVQNSWLWQMHEDIALDDQSHETLWRQLLRWLLDGVPPQINVRLSTHLGHAGGTIGLRSEILRSGPKQTEAVEARAVLSDSYGFEKVITLNRHRNMPDVYETDIITAEPGDYRLRVEYDGPAGVVSSEETRFRVTPEGSEFFASQMNDALLRNIAAETRGAFYTPDQMHRLAD
ncbi:MAG: VWA domain-containing protein, partial [Gammaproteobacteria bacterium]|nr:VWA domain-containing protein [Gammaproteobacteria bacterium]